MARVVVSKVALNRKLFSGVAASVTSDALQQLKEDSAGEASADPRPKRDSPRGDLRQLKGLGKMGVPGDVYRFGLRRFGFVSSSRSFSSGGVPPRSTSDAFDFTDGSDGEDVDEWDLSDSDGENVYSYFGYDRHHPHEPHFAVRLPPGALWKGKEYNDRLVLKVVVPGQGKDVMFDVLRMTGSDLLIVMEEEEEDEKNDDEEVEKGPIIYFPEDLFDGDSTDAESKDGVVTIWIPKVMNSWSCALQSNLDELGMVETVTDKVFSSRYGASLLPNSNYGALIQAGLLTDSKDIRKFSCKAVLRLLDKAEDGAAAVETVVQHNLYPLLINCLIEGDEEISAVILDAVKRLAQIPKGAEIIFPPGGGSVQLGLVAAQSSSLARIRILSLIAKLFTVSSYTATSIRDSNLLSIFEDEIKDRRDMLKTLSALEVLYELVEHPHSNIFLLKTNLLQLITDVINDSSADSVIRSRAALISGRLLSSADAFAAVDQSYVTNLLVAIDKMLKMEESMNTDEIESALETLGLIGTTTQGAHFLLTSSNVTRHVVKSSFDRQGRGRQLAALHAFGSICGADRQEDQMKLDGEAEDCLKRLIYTTAANSPKLTPSALLLSILQQDPDIRIAGYRVISGLVVREWCLREVCLNSEIIKLVTDPTMETTKLGMEARYDCCVAINKALSSSHLLHEASLSELVGKLNDAVKRGPYLSDRKRMEAQPVVVPAERF